MINTLVYVQEIMQAQVSSKHQTKKQGQNHRDQQYQKMKGKKKKYIQMIMVSITSIVIEPKHKQLKKRYQ